MSDRKISVDIIKKAIQVAKAVFDKQTAEELEIIKHHVGKMYDEGQIVAEIAVKLALRIAGVQVESDLRAFAPVDLLVEKGLSRMS